MTFIPIIESYAVQITGAANVLAPEVRAKITEWSAWNPGGGTFTVTIGKKTLGQIKPGWVTAIYRKALKEYTAWCLDHGVQPPPNARIPKAKKIEATALPMDGEYNHPADLPF